MKNRKYIVLLAAFLVIAVSNSLNAQRNEWVKQIIIANGGRFEVNPPYIDYVTIQAYDPVTQAVTIFDTIYTQSVQDVVIHNNHAFVAAQDSIIEYDLDTYERLIAIDDSGMSRLGIYNERLIVTKQFPIKRFFVEILDISNNLGLLARVQNISGDCGGVVVSDKDSIYVAVFGEYPTTRGKLAVISPSDWTLQREIDLDTVAKGINDLYNYSGKIFSVNVTPYGASPKGSVSQYNPFINTHSTKVLQVKVGEGIGIDGNLLYLKLNDGIGSFDLDQNSIADTTIIPDPGFVQHKYIIGGAVDYVNHQFYLNIGNQQSWGIGIVTTNTGDSLTSFTEQISAEGIAIDYRTPVGVDQPDKRTVSVSLHPNPVADYLFVRMTGKTSGSILRIFDITGRELYMKSIQGTSALEKIDCSEFPSGIYFLRLDSPDGMKTGKIIKQ